MHGNYVGGSQAILNRFYYKKVGGLDVELLEMEELAVTFAFDVLTAMRFIQTPDMEYRKIEIFDDVTNLVAVHTFPVRLEGQWAGPTSVAYSPIRILLERSTRGVRSANKFISGWPEDTINHFGTITNVAYADGVGDVATAFAAQLTIPSLTEFKPVLVKNYESATGTYADRATILHAAYNGTTTLKSRQKGATYI